MTPQQARQLLHLAFHQQSLTAEIMKGADAALVASLRIIAGRIKTLPPEGDLLREQTWRRMKPQIMQELDQFSRRFGEEVINALKGEAVAAERFALEYVQAAPERRVSPKPLVDPTTPQAVPMFINNQDLPVTTGRIYFNAIAQTEVVGQKFTKLFGKSIDEAGGILTVGSERTGMARFFMTSIDRMATEGILKGETTEEIAQNLIFDSIRRKDGLNLGKTARQLKGQATTVARTAVANALNRAHEAFWDANNDWEWEDEEGNKRSGKIIEGYIFDAVTDSRACPECAMYDQKFAKRREELPSTPLHPRCRCIRRPVTGTELELMKEDRKKGQTGGTGIQLYQASELPGKKKGESAKDFIKRKREERRAAVAAGKDLPERWYATPVKQNGKTFYRVARDLPVEDGTGVRRVPEWLAKTNRTTQVEFFGGGKPGIERQKAFEALVDKGMDPREALNKLLQQDRVDGFKRYRFKPAASLG